MEPYSPIHLWLLLNQTDNYPAIYEYSLADKIMMHFKRIIFLSACCLFAVAVNAQQASPSAPGNLNTDSLKIEMAKQKKATAKQFAKTQLKSMVIKADNNCYGYYLLADGQLLIEQKTIPAIPGNNGFISQAEAKRTADFAIKKLKQGEMPPTISVEELKKLKITGVK